MQRVRHGEDTERDIPAGLGRGSEERGRREGDGVGLVGGTRRAKSVRASFVMYSKIVS
jgi:hypothetical protein